MMLCDAERIAGALLRHEAEGGVDVVSALLGLKPTGDILRDAVRIVAESHADSQERVAALYIAMTHGVGRPMNPDLLTLTLQAAFPDNKVGRRHAPFYMSKARTGQLVGLPPGLVLQPIPNIPRGSRPLPPARVVPTSAASSSDRVPPPEPVIPAEPPPPPTDDPAAMAREELIAWLISRGASTEGRTVELIRRAQALQVTT